MKYSIEDLHLMRSYSRIMAIYSLMHQHISKEIRASNYEIAALTESILQTHITAGLKPQNMTKTAEIFQDWIDNNHD